MWKLLLLLIGAEIIAAIAPQSVCDWSRKHDGHGDSEDEEGTFPTDIECVQHCEEKKKTKPEINGATVRRSDKMCWCEIGMNKKEADDKYDACYLKADISQLVDTWKVKWSSGTTATYSINKDGKLTVDSVSCSSCKKVLSANVQLSDNSHLPSSTWYLIKPIHRPDVWMYFRLNEEGKLKLYWFKKSATSTFKDVAHYYGKGGEGTGVRAGQWSEWRVWGHCSATCGGGELKRSRECLDSKGGVSTDCVGDAAEVEPCNVDVECPPVCGEWQGTKCTVTCGGGQGIRTRDCEKGGVKSTEQEVHECNAVECPEVCGEWKITPCTVTCGGGEERKTRECEKGGVIRTEGEVHECNAVECPHPCAPTLGGNGAGSCCTFPFTYQGETHHQCTDKGWHTFWCATTDNYDTDGKWGECDFDDSCLATEGGNADPGQACHFPFIYRGKQVTSCIKIRHNRLWCATTDNYDTDWKWGNCLPEKTMCSFPPLPLK